MFAPLGTAATVSSQDPDEVVPWVVRLRSRSPLRARRHCLFTSVPMCRCATPLKPTRSAPKRSQPGDFAIRSLRGTPGHGPSRRVGYPVTRPSAGEK